jgi:hypothetical protein
LITLPAPTQQSIAQGRKKNREKIGKKVYCPLDKERAISTTYSRDLDFEKLLFYVIAVASASSLTVNASEIDVDSIFRPEED